MRKLYEVVGWYVRDPFDIDEGPIPCVTTVWAENIQDAFRLGEDRLSHLVDTSEGERLMNWYVREG